MATVLVNHLRVRAGPSVNTPEVAYYDAGQKIYSTLGLVENEGRTWLKYQAASGNIRYICQRDINGNIFIDCGPPPPPSETGIPGIPKQTAFGHESIRNWGCCFLCTCVKGGLTTASQCVDCFNWGMSSGKLRWDCWINCDKVAWAREISQKYGTPYHEDYIFQKSVHRDNSTHFWLTQGGREIFNSMGIGYH